MKMTLTIKTPVHIGIDEKRFRDDYIQDTDQGLLTFPDVDAYFRDNREKISEFVEHMQCGGDLKSYFGTDDSEYTRYSIRYQPSSNGSEDIPNTLYPMLKDPENRPYIPGTTLKGWIRTALAYRVISSNAANLRATGDPIDQLFRVGEENSARGDLLRCITVEDTDTVPISKAMAYQVTRFSLQTDGSFEAKSFNNFYECFRPGTTLTTELSVQIDKLQRMVQDSGDRETAERLFGPDLTVQGITDTIRHATRSFATAISEKDQDGTPSGIRSIESVDLAPTDTLFRIGAGTGYHSKSTILGYTGKRRLEELIHGIFGEHGEKNDPNEELRHKDCGGRLRPDLKDNNYFYCIDGQKGKIPQSWEEVIRFPKSSTIIHRDKTALYPFGWIQVAFNE